MFQLGQQCLAFALCVAQHGVQQAFGPRFFQLVGATHGFTDGGVRGNAGVEQLIQADQQQGLDVGVCCFERLLKQLVGQRGQAWLPACRAECEVLGQAAVADFDFIQL